MARLQHYLPYAVLALSLAILAGGVLVNALESGGSGEPIVFQAMATSPDGTLIRVHVAGEVQRPGVYELEAGDRVGDAIDAAGGLTGAADAVALNRARRLRDGERLVVPAKSSRPTSSATAPLSATPLDLNAATEAQLDQLPGIGEAYARRIVDSRTVDGPFKSVDDLLSRRVLPAATLDTIRPLITVVP